ncbi:MAG: TIGR00159 family protein [Clostridiales bacterium]|jgi:diadenylate cyclase|nr:TIGR00159 family protein [Clostridiales bacterium]
MDFIQNVWSAFVSLIKSFQVADALDVILVSFIIYKGIKLVRETRAEQLVKGILILVGVWIVSFYLQLHMMMYILNAFLQFGVIALVILFQPELRRVLEQLGRSRVGGKYLSIPLLSKEPEDIEKMVKTGIRAVADACINLQKQKMGALVVFEMQTKLGDIIDTGTVVNAEPSAALIGNIFFNKAPLHDGAMVIRHGMVCAAGCILPLTKNDSISIDLGTRHRAALGMSENSDAIIVVVSEETGQISIAVNGVLTRNYTRESLISQLESLILPEPKSNEKRQSKIPSIRRKKKK